MKKTTIALLLLLPGIVAAQGFFVGEDAVGPAGMAGASVAFPEDLSTAMYNPAGLVRVENGIQGNLSIVNFNKGSYDRAPDEQSNFQPYDTVELEQKTYVGGPFVAIAHDFGLSRFRFAFSSNLQFGSKLKFDPDGVQRYMMKEVELLIMNQNFSTSFAIDDHWSVGGALVWASAKVDEQVDLDLVSLLDPTQLPSEEQENRLPTTVSLDDNAFGFNLGVLYQRENLRFGFMYESEITMKLGGDVTTDLSLVPDVIKEILGVAGNELVLKAKMDMTLPQYIRIGGSYRPTEKLWLAGEFFWIDWSTLKAFDVKLAPNPINVTSYVIPRNWDDGYAFKVGASYDQSEKNKFRAGLFYVLAPTKQETVQLDIPDNDRFGFTLGYSRNFTKHFSADAAYVHQFLQSWHIDNSIQNPPVNGDIEVNFGTLLLGMRYRF